MALVVRNENVPPAAPPAAAPPAAAPPPAAAAPSPASPAAATDPSMPNGDMASDSKDKDQLDLSGLPSVPLKKTLLMVNSFVLSTTGFLNKFSALCEQKLEKLSRDVQRIEIVLAILEGKLNSIPWLDAAAPPTEVSSGPPPNPSEAGKPSPDAAAASGDAAAGAPPPAPAAAGAPPPAPPVAGAPPPAPPVDGADSQALVPVEETPAEDPRLTDPMYVKFFKMLKMGVARMAIENRMISEGLDPSVLDLVES